MMSFVREKKWISVGLSVVRRGPDNASEVCAKWRDQQTSQFLSPEAKQAVTTISHLVLRIIFEPVTRHTDGLLSAS